MSKPTKAQEHYENTIALTLEIIQLCRNVSFLMGDPELLGMILSMHHAAQTIRKMAIERLDQI